MKKHAPIAQLVEQDTFNVKVTGSSPVGGTLSIDQALVAKEGDRVTCYGLECEIEGIKFFSTTNYPYFKLKIISGERKKIPKGRIKDIERCYLTYHLISFSKREI